MLRDKTKNRAKTSLFLNFQTALERVRVVLAIYWRFGNKQGDGRAIPIVLA